MVYDLKETTQRARMPALSATEVHKHFGGVRALNGVTVELWPGSVTALLGENGAGKSTFINICSGALRPDQGVISLAGQRVEFHSPLEALQQGIAVVHQEPALADDLDVAENILLSRLATRSAYRIAQRRGMQHDAQAHLDRLGLSGFLQPGQICRDLTAAQRQLVEIARSLVGHPRILFLDEPNSSLTRSETELLFNVVRALRNEGIAVVFVTHRIREVYEIAERVIVLRDGLKVADTTPADLSPEGVLKLMAGTKLQAHQQQNAHADVAVMQQRPVLEAEHLTGKGFADINLALYPGQIVGIAGLVGSGRTEIARALVGADRVMGGRILMDGMPVTFRGPRDGLSHGIAFVSEERRTGVFPAHNIAFNITASMLDQLQRFGIHQVRQETRMANDAATRLGIKATSIRQSITDLSGGNQQKVLLARALASAPKLLVLDEPTRGVDVGTKAEIYELLRDLAKQGIAICFISSELEEILALAQRIVVVRQGRIVKDTPAGPDAHDILSAAFGEATDAKS